MAINDDNPLDFSSFGTPVDDGATPFDNFATPQPTAAKPRSTYGFNPDIETAIDDAAGTHGVDPDLMRTFARIESGGDPRKRTGSYNGLFMLSADEFKRFGGDADIFDPAANARAAALKFKSEEADFEKNYGRKPSASELYFLHQQGVGGADAHWRNPEAPAWENMYRTAEGRQKGPAWAKQAIWGNLPDSEKRRFGSVENITSRDFTDFWDRRVRDLSGQNKSVQVAQAPRQTMTDALDFSQFGTPVSEKPLDFTKQAVKPESDDRWEISKGFVGGFIGGNPKNFGDALVGFGHVFERPELLSRGDDIAKWGKDKLENYKARIPSFTDIRTDGVLNFLSDLGSYAGYQTGQAVASSLPSLATGAILGGTLRNPTAARVGWWAGASVPSFIQNYGDVYGSVREDEGIQKRIKAGEITEREAATWSMMAGGAMAALDTWGLEKVLGGAFKEAKADLKRRILAGMVKGAATEGPTEAMQEVISQWAQYWLGSEKTLKQAAIEVVDNFFGGVFGGGAIGGATSAIQKPAAKAEPAPDGGRVELDAAKGKVSPSAPRTTPPPLPEEGPEMSLPDVPGKPATETPPPSPEEMSVLRRMGYTEVDIRDMEPEQRFAEMEDAKSRGIVSDVPSAEPIQDIVAQARDLADPENDRRGLYLSPDNVRQIQENPDFIEQIGAALRNQGELVQNIDGNGGILLTKDAATADAVRTAIQGGQDLQQVLGEVTGAGQGKPADATAVVQQVTPEGAVTRESAVTQDQVAPTLDAFKADGRDVRAVTPEEAIARREQGRATPLPLPTEQVGDGSRQAPVRVETPEDIARAEQRVAEPTDGQKDAGNYSKGHLKFQGLDITIENPKGSIRRGTSPDGTPWEVAMPTTYGYLKRSVGRDGDQVDVYVGPNPKSDRVFIIDQVDPDTGKFDEHKAMIGYNTISAARVDYEQAFSDGRAAERMGGVTEMTVAKFKDWLAKGKRTRPLSKLDEKPDTVAEQPTETTQEQADKLPDNLTDAERETLVKAWRYVNAIEQARAQGRDIQQQRLDIANELDADLASYGIEFDSFPDEQSLREHLGRSRGTDQAGDAVAQAPEAAQEPEAPVAEGSGRPGSQEAEVVQRDQADRGREGARSGERAAEVERPKRYEGDPLSSDDIDTIVEQWKYLREVANRPKPESLAAFVVARGGIRDDAREVRHIAGAAKERPGLVNKDGWTLDDIALSAWEAGFMGDMAERPTIADFLDRLQDDLHTGTVVRTADEPLLDDIAVANEIARELADYGVTTNRFRSENTLREYFGQERPRVAGEAARDEEAEPATKGRQGQARPDQDEVILPPDEAPETGPSDSGQPKTRRDFIAALTDGVNDRGNEVVAPNGTTFRIDFKPSRNTYVVVSKEPGSDGIAFTKGPVGFSKWSRPQAANEAADAAYYPDDEDAIHPSFEASKVTIATEKSGQTSLVPEATTKEKIAAEAKKKGDRGKANADLDAGELFNPDAGKQTDLVDMAKAAPVSKAGWKEGNRDPDLVMKLDDDGEVIGSVMFDRERQKRDRKQAWAALDGDGNVIGYAPTLGDAKDLVDGKPAADPYITGKESARDHVLTNGRKTGTEYGMVVLADGSTKPVTPSERNSKSYLEVSAKTAPDLYDGSAKSADLHHNHPKSSSFSRADYTEASVRPALRRTWVHGHDGSEYWASFKTNDPVALGKAYDIAMAVTETLTEKGYDLPRYRTHIIATMLRDGGLIEYGAALTPARADERIAKIREKLGEDNIAKAIEDIRKLGDTDVYDRRPGSTRSDRDVAGTPNEPAATGSEVAGSRPSDTTRPEDGRAEKDGTAREVSPRTALRDRLLSEGFDDIREARKFAREIGIDGSNKQIDEAVEAAVVDAARDIVEEGKNQGATYRDLVALYDRQPNLTSRTGTSVANQAYSTPMPLAYLASRLAGVAKADSVYEPTAGNGALLIEVADKGKAKVNELDPARAKALKDQGFTVTTNDGSITPSFKNIESVIMNPPFGAVKEGGKSKEFQVGDWSTTQIDHAVALNALEAMDDNGKAVLILGGIKATDVKERRKGYRGQAKREFYFRLYNQYNVVDHFTVDGDLYKKQGAGWPVDVVVIDGRGKSDRALPAANPPMIFDSWEALAEKLPNASNDARTPDRPARDAVGRVGQPDGRDAVGGEPVPGSGVERPAAEPEAKPARVRKDADRGQPADAVEPAAAQPRDQKPGSDRDGGRVDQPVAARKPRVERKQPPKGSGQANYEATSTKAESLDTLIPVNMADAAKTAMQRVAQKHGSVDALVADRLGYNADDLAKYFSAEQIDGIASAIDNVERGSAMIIGHQTGIGKGRIAAGMLRYAMKQGMKPVFVTEKPDLYGDMFRDLRDIGVPEMLGREPNMFITNAGASIPLDEEALAWKQEADLARENGEKVPPKRGKFLTGGTSAKIDATMRKLANAEGGIGGDGLPDVIFTTYDQMNTVKGQDTDRRKFIDRIASESFVVLDESHNAGGAGQGGWERRNATPDRATFVRNLAAKAKGVMFSSATYAKRPDVMDLYARTDMGRAVDDPKRLPELIQRGGVPMQQIVASMLANAGQYQRLERSFEGVEYAVEGVPVNQKSYRQFSSAIRAIFKFDLAVKDARKEIMEDILDAKGMAMSKDSGVGESAAHTTAFASIMHNITNQMLLAIKSGQAAKRAIQAVKDGEKPVIALANTNESFIKDFAEQENITLGQALDMDFSEVLRRYLARTLRVTIKHPDKTKEHVDIPVARLGAGLQRMYADAMSEINEGTFDGMPISPIDWIRHEVTQAGLKVAEVTGRQTMIDYGASKPKYVARPKSEMGPAGKRGSIAAFNRGALDVLILNRSGSTGVSMHASKSFRDQRRRRMIIAQAEGNIDTHLQMLGRVHRTGQVQPPAYSQIAAEIPAEARPTAVLMKKMASLNANTTGARGSVFMADSVDFMNEIGDKVVADILNEDADINDELGGALKVDNDGVPVNEDAARRATGRLVLLDPDKQAEFLERVQKAYQSEIEQLDALGENPLEAKTLDLQAKTIDTTVLKPKQGDSPFLDEVRVEKVSVKAQGRAMLPKDVAAKVAESLKSPRPEDDIAGGLRSLESKGRAAKDDKIRETVQRAREWIRTDIADLSPDAQVSTRRRHEEQVTRWVSTMNVVYPGSRVTLAMPAGEMEGVVMSVERTGKAKLPVALGSWEVRIAVPDGAREYVFPFSKLFPPGVVKSEDEKGAAIAPSSNSHADMIGLFEEARKEGRETRFIVSGNILGGFDQVAGKGRIVNYTTESGEMRPGVLMGREFDLEKFMGKRAVRFQEGNQVAKFLEAVPAAEIKDIDGNIVIRSRRGAYSIETPSSRALGGRYYTDPQVRRSTGGKEFERRGNKMIVDGLSRTELVRTIDAMRTAGAIFETREAQDVAQGIIAPGMREESEAEDFPRVNEAGFVLALPFEAQWGNPRFIKADRERAIARLREIQSIDPDTAPWDDLVQAKKDIDRITTNLFYWDPKTVEGWKSGKGMAGGEPSSNEIWSYLDELDNGEFWRNRVQNGARQSIFSDKNVPADLAEFADEGGQAVDSLLDSKRKGIRELLKWDDEVDPAKPKRVAAAGNMGDRMPSGFYFKAARKIDEARETLFQMSGQSVINWLMKEGVSRAEINHFQLQEKFGGDAKFTRDEFKQAIGERMFDFRRKMSWLNPERSRGNYELGGTRAFTGPRVPGQGIYFERPIAFPKRLAGGARFAPGEFESPHWYDVLKNAWASWRGSIREVPGWGTMLVGEEGQSDYMQGANTGRRPKISQAEYLERKAMQPKYKKVYSQAHDLIQTALGGAGPYLNDVTKSFYNTLTPPTRKNNVVSQGDWLAAIERLRDYIHSDTVRRDVPAQFRAVQALIDLRDKNEIFFTAEGAEKYSGAAEFTPDTPIDDNYVRVMARDLLLMAAEKAVNSVAISTTATTGRIQNNRRAAHFYDTQMKPALERELRTLTGKWDLTLEKIALPKALGSPKSERPYTVWAAKLDDATIEKIAKQGMPLMSVREAAQAQTDKPKISRLDHFKGRLLLRQAVDLSEDAKPIFDIMNAEPSILPGMIPEAVITKLTPKKGTDKYIVTARDQYGEEHTFEDEAKKITRTQGQYLVANGRPLVVLTPLDFGGDFVQTVRTVRAHEAVHALRIAGFLPGGSRDAGTPWGRLVSHADLLGVLHMSRADFYKRLGDPRAATASKDVSTFKVYTTLYGHLNTRIALELYHQEAVAHMMEVYVAGGWTDQEIAPVKAILDDILSGKTAQWTDVSTMPLSAGMLRSAADNEDGALGTDRVYSLQDTITGQSMRRDLDNLGFYSKALDAAKSLKQERGTPEQMLAQLKKAGVKDAEIEATGLANLFREKAGSTTALESDAITLPPKRLEWEDFSTAAKSITTAPRDVGPYDLVAWHSGGYVNYDLVNKGATSAYDDNGDSISKGSFKVKAGQNGGVEVTNARIADEAMQKKGIGTRVYDIIQKDFGDIPLMPSPWNQLSPNAVAFWAKRDRKKLEWTRQQQVESYEGDRYPDRVIPQQQGDRTASPPRRARLNQISKSEIVKYLEDESSKLTSVLEDGQPMFSMLPSAQSAVPANVKNISRDITEAISIITRMTGRDAVQVEFRDQIETGGVNPDQIAASRMAGFATRTAGGVYNPRRLDAKPLIALATNDPAYDLRTAAGHEAFHHVERELASEAELRLLTSDSEMRRMRAMASDELQMSPSDPRLAKLQDVEVRAIAFQRYRRMREEGLANASRLHIGIRRFFDKMIQILQGVRNVLKGKGFDSYEAIFERARTGEMKAARDRRAVDQAASQRPVRTARNIIDPQMRPAGYVEREPFDVNNVRLVGRSMLSVPVDAIRTIQKSVSVGRVKAKLGLPESDDGRPVSVFKYGDTYYVNDGNHRIEAMRARGAKTIRAEVIEIEPKDGNAEVLADRGQADVPSEPVGAQEDYEGAQASLTGGTPLDMSKEARMARAEAMGFDTSTIYYHGSPDFRSVRSKNEFERRSISKYNRSSSAFDASPQAIYFSTERRVAATYADDRRAFDYQNAEPEVFGSYLRLGNVLDLNAAGKKFSEMPAIDVQRQIPQDRQAEFSSLISQYGSSTDGTTIRTGDLEVVAQMMGYDSFRIRNVRDTYDGKGKPTTIVAVFNPERIRDVNAAFDPAESNSPQLMASLIPAAARAYTARWIRRMQPYTDNIRTYLQDKVLPVRRQEEAIEASTGAKLPDQLSVYMAEAIYHGRAGERLTDFQEKHVEPLTEHLRKSGIVFNEIGDYLYARHAKERNAAIRVIDPTNNAGSGMTDAEANGIIGALEQGKRGQAFKTAAKMIDAMVTDARDTLYRSGLLTKEQYDNWRTKYQHYVPLRGFEGEVEEWGIPRVGRGMDIRGPESKQALGRRSKADNPAAYVMQQAVQAIIRSEKNRVDKTLYRLIQAHPDPDVWKVYRGEARRRINPTTGLVEMYWVPPPFAARNNDKVFGVKIAGKQHYMEILHEPLARALRTGEPGILGTAPGRAFFNLARFYARLVTSFNPEFVVSNYLRDIQTALMNVGDVANKPDGTRKKIIAEALSLKSIRGVMAALQSHEGRTIFGGTRAADENMLGMKRSKEAQDYAKWFEEYRLAGGKISFIEMNDIDRIKNRIEKSITEGKTRRALRNVFDLIDNANSAVENGVRLSAYIALRKNGVSQDKAAFAARELTVNFNRKGEYGPAINAFYLFFNASVQGTTRLAQALFRSPAVAKGAAAIVLAGALFDLLNYMIAGDDDDGENAYEKIDEWKKEKNMIVMLPGRKDYVQIPMPYGYNVFYLFGQKTAALSRTAAGYGKEKPAKAIAGLLGAMVESFSPMGAAPSWLQMASPTLADPFVQIAENKSWFGGKIQPEKYNKFKPDSENFFSTAPAWAIDLARALNRLSGGSAVKSGSIDVSPESIEHIADFLGGGVSKFVGNIWNTGQRAMNGQEWIPEKTPFVRRVYGKSTGESRRRDFYEQWNEVDSIHYQFDTLRKAQNRDGMAEIRKENPAELQAYEMMRTTQRQLSALRKQADVINLNREIDAVEKEKRLKLLTERENEIILRALKTYARLKKEKAPKD